MAHQGNLGSDFVLDRHIDPRGVTVSDRTGQKIGQVTDALFDHSRMKISYVVVEDGPKRFLLPSNSIFLDPKRPNTFVAEVSRQEIADLPPYQQASPGSQEEWQAYEENYKKAWRPGPVQHRPGTDRNITPDETSISAAPAEHAQERGRGPISTAGLFPERLAPKFPDPAPGAGRIAMRPSVSSRTEEAAAGMNMLRPRWEALEEFLQSNRERIGQSCVHCRESGKSDAA